MPVLLTLQEVSEMLQVSKHTLYRLTKNGELPSLRVGKSLRYDAKEIYEYMRKNVKEYNGAS